MRKFGERLGRTATAAIQTFNGCSGVVTGNDTGCVHQRHQKGAGERTTSTGPIPL